ncbi:MAG: dihydropteroate synthase [Rhizobiaceae bacterium]
MKKVFQPRRWSVAHGRSLELGPKAQIMGVLNVTPDSFSDGGKFIALREAETRAREMGEQGASIIDIGGESTRPGAEEIDGVTERKRVLPVIEMLADTSDLLISIDTYRADTAKAAIRAGAHIVNDVWGCQREPAIARVASETGAGLVIMHTGRERQVLPDIIDDQFAFLKKSLKIADKAGVARQQIVLDPGFGFGKDLVINLQLLNRLAELHPLETPLLIGTSRKRFLGSITGQEPEGRGIATAATSVVGRMKGIALFRVHDIIENRDALAVTDALIFSESKR